MISKKEIAKRFFDSLKEKDFKSFCNFVKIKNIKDGSLFSFDYDHWNWEQKQFYQKFSDPKRKKRWDIVIKPRRIGMSTFGCLQDYFFALVNPGRNIMIIAQSDDVTKELFETIKDLHDSLEQLSKAIGIRLVPTLEKNNRTEMKFANGSRIMIQVAKAQLASAKKTARGKTISRLHCSEVAFWSYPAETMLSVLEAASQAQEVLIESTANGAHGWFYEQVQADGKSNYELHFFPWFSSENCRIDILPSDFEEKPQNKWEQVLVETYKIDKHQLQWWRQKIETHGQENVLQEYPIDKHSCFRSKDSSFIPGDDEVWLYENIKQPILIEELPNKLVIQTFEEPRPGERYIIGVDCAFGRGQDNSAFYILDSQAKIVCCGHSNEIQPYDFGETMFDVGTKYNDALLVVEIQGPGHTVVSVLENAGYPNLFKHDHKDYYGWNTTVTSRTTMFYHIQTYIKDKAQTIPDIGLIQELRAIKIVKAGDIEKPAAAKGNTDDRVLSFGIALTVWHSVPQIENISYRSIQKSEITRNMLGKSLGRFGKGFI